jgi:signal transduction histidine kinase
MSSGDRTPCHIVVDSGGPPPIRGAAADLVAAVVNLVANAIDAMPRGGTITVSTGVDDAGPWLEVADDGPGMPPEVRDRVFEPFFTTKGEAGTGLGLAMVYACMVRHAGTVELTSAPGQGSRFRLRFPR